MWDLGFLTKETPIAPRGRMVRALEALVVCGIGAFLSMKQRLR